MHGETGLQLAVGPAAKGRQQVDMTFMMEATGIDLPQISWAKQPGEPGRASLQLQLFNGRIEAAEDIDLALGSLSAAGRLIFANDGQLQGGFVAPLKLPGQDIDQLLLERLGDGTMQISAEGNRVDLTSLRRGDGLSEGRALSLDITAGLIQVDDILRSPAIWSGRQIPAAMGLCSCRARSWQMGPRCWLRPVSKRCSARRERGCPASG